VPVVLTDEEFLREAVAGVLAREAIPAAVRGWADSQYTASPDAPAERQGLTRIGLEERLGGLGGGIVELAVMSEELGRVALPRDCLLGGCSALQLVGVARQEGGIPRAGAPNGAPGVAASEMTAAKLKLSSQRRRPPASVRPCHASTAAARHTRGPRTCCRIKV
jgi:alkylation response protein AidB-like acyl-CoA dehydrogenase